MILKPDHFFFQASPMVETLVQPLKHYFGITSFIYQKNFNDGSQIRLSNTPQWCSFFYEQALYKKSIFEGQPSQYFKNRVLWKDASQQQAVLSKAREFNIAHGITFVEPAQDGCELFCMGAAVDQPEVMNRYLRHIDLLEKFMVYFRERATRLIEEARQNRVFIPDKFNEVPRSFIETQDNVDKQGFLNALTPQIQVLSPREQMCVDLLLKGYTVKMIGNELRLSPRTIETYIEHVKLKTKTHTKAELLKVLRQLNYI